MHVSSYKKRYNILFATVCIALSFGPLVTAQTILPDPITPDALCGDMDFLVKGNSFVKPQQKQVYTIHTNSILDQQANVEFELRQENTLIESGTEHQFMYTFPAAGKYILKTLLRRSQTCIQFVEKPIVVTDKIRVGIGLNEQDSSFLAQSITEKGVGFILLPPTNDAITEEAKIQRVQDVADVLPHSDVVFVEESQARLLFDHLDDIRTYGLGFPERIILVGNINTLALRRLVHQSPLITNFSEIALVPELYITSVIQHILTNKSLEDLDVVRLVHLREDTSNRRLPLSTATDYLLLQGMSINFIVFLLCLPFVSLCLVILKQVVGFNVGGIYYLLLTAAGVMFVGRENTIIMFFSALFGWLLAQYITKKIYLLYAPKVGLTITLTSISYLLLMILLLQTGYLFTLPKDPVNVFFPLIAFSMMMQYIYPNHDSILQKSWWIGFGQFIGGVVVVIFLFQQSWLQQLVLGYPDSIILIFFATLYIGRFAGLQVGEYIRFRPLIAKHLTQDEE